MAIVVQKYGGSSVADVPKLLRVAQKVVALRNAGDDVVVVISAMGKTTDQLLALARSIDASPPRRELDMLVTTGERVSMALLSMAIQKHGQDAISFTGSQSGIITNDRHFDARILEVRPFRIEDELARGRVVIVAGYQGMSYRREITTLGRGGSDTTAIALAAALGAERAEIYSDVDGVYSADPRVVPDAVHLPTLGYEAMQEMAEAGAKVLNSTAVEFAKKARIAIHARSTFSGERETIVSEGAAGSGPAVVGRSDLAHVTLEPASLPRAFALAEEHGLTVCESRVAGDRATLVVSRAAPAWPRAADALGALGATIDPEVGAVTIVAQDLAANPGWMRDAMSTLEREGVTPLAITTAPLRFSALVPAERVDACVRALHAEVRGG